MFAAGFNTPGFKVQNTGIRVYQSRCEAVASICGMLDEYTGCAVASSEMLSSGHDDFAVQGLEVFVRNIG